jgi:hypothetical protein
MYELFDRFTWNRIHRGFFRRYSSDAILHQIRWHTEMPNPAPGDEFKCNDHWTAHYSRMWTLRHPMYFDFFEKRHIADDDLPDCDYYGPPDGGGGGLGQSEFDW